MASSDFLHRQLPLFLLSLFFILFLLLLCIFPPNDQNPFPLIISQNIPFFYSSKQPSFPQLPLRFPTDAAPAAVDPTLPHSSGLKRKKIEEDLGGARAAIQEAIITRTRSYTSDTVESFIPSGPVYRNAYAFHQSHIEMVKRFKVWSYKEGEQPLVHDGPTRHIYSIEGHFIDEMDSGKSPFAAQHPDEAHVFFLPVSIANIVNYIYKPITTYARDRLVRVFTDYVSVVANKYPYWNRTRGADHFMASCHDWAPETTKEDPNLFKNLIRVLCNANTSEGFNPIRDASLPEINLPATFNLNPPQSNQPPQNRSILAFFAGGAHGSIRQTLIQHWKNKDDEIQVHEYLPENQNYGELIGRSRFCLCPSGFEVASPRLVEAIRGGCVPVIISDSYSLPFDDVLDWSRFSIRIPPEKIPEIKRILEEVSPAKYLRLRRGVMNVQRHFVIHRPAEPFDVFYMVLHSVWLRRLNIKLSN